MEKINKYMMLDGRNIVLLLHSNFHPSKKWTCVKFADGRIEWVATSRLTKNIHTRAIEFIIGMGFGWNQAANLYVIVCLLSVAMITTFAGFLMWILFVKP